MSFVCKVVSTFSATIASLLMPPLMKLVNQGHSCRQASQSVFFIFSCFHFLRTVWQIFYEWGFEITTLWTMYTINVSHENKNIIEYQVVSQVVKGGSNGCDCPPLSLFHRTFCLCRSNPQTKVSMCVFTKRGHALCLQDMIYNHHSCPLLLAIVAHFLIILITCKSVSILGHLEIGLNKCAFHTPFSGNGVHSYWLGKFWPA